MVNRVRRVRQRRSGASAKPLDPLVKRAISHPFRAHILASIADRPLSPVEVARECDLPLANVAYHFRVLRDRGCIALDESSDVGHVYRASGKADSGFAKRYEPKS